jgi:predicted transposase YdaD
LDFNRFDVATKELVAIDPTAWIEGLGIGSGEGATIIDSGITALTAAADKVIKVVRPKPYLVTIEFQSSCDSELLRSIGFRQAALEYQHRLAVRTVLLLLRKEANSPSLTGVYEYFLPDGESTTRYHYRVKRLWEESPEQFLAAEVGLAALAPLADVRAEDVPGLIHRVAERIRSAPTDKVETLALATYVLMGLRYSAEITALILKEFPKMRESATYQQILQEGRDEGRVAGRVEGQIAEARQLLLRQARKQLGEPVTAILGELEEIRDLDRLESLLDQVLDRQFLDWDELVRASRKV